MAPAATCSLPTTVDSDTFAWDWANRLTGATVNGQSVAYTYDAMNVRVGATVNGVTSNYLWDRTTALPQLVDDGANAYLHGAGPMAQIDGSGARYELMADGLGLIRALTDGSGAPAGTARPSHLVAGSGSSASEPGSKCAGEGSTPSVSSCHVRSMSAATAPPPT